MVALWITIGLVISTLCVSILGASFSIVGIGALFSGALLAVWAMAASLELAKFVLAAYIHQRWKELNLIYRSYLVFAIVVLSLITSMGIFGFLSDAYQSASTAMDAGNIKIDALKTQLANHKGEIARMNQALDEIPATRVSKRINARNEMEPLIKQLNLKIETAEKEISTANLDMLEIKKKVGPLIYISRAFKIDIDDVVKYLVLVLVSVFDPLAICLVIAMSQAIDSRRRGKLVVTSTAPVETVASVTETSASAPELAPSVAEAVPAPVAPAAEMAAAPLFPPHGGDDEEMLLMRFTDDEPVTPDTKTKNGNAV
ncbi:MAG: hypothetical protein H7061_01070 [Bdellovibrionaceae bacterium]|nr:hypothetical protein [Bdellovibrio sp.]